MTSMENRVRIHMRYKLQKVNFHILHKSGFQALGYMGEEFMMQMFGKYIEMANSVRLPCHLNLAACMLKKERWEEVVNNCNVVSETKKTQKN